MTTSTAAVRLPQGNSGREYAVRAAPADDHLFPVVVEPMTGRRVLPTAVARFAATDARALGVRLIEVATLDDYQVATDATPTFRAYGGRGYRVALAGNAHRARRIRLVVAGRDGAILPSISDAFSSGNARALGVALIAAAGP